MSSPILPIQGPTGHTRPTPDADATLRGVAAFASALADSERTITIDASRGGPPPEVLEQMSAAGEINERLRQDGQELRFSAPLPGRRVGVELCDIDGATATSVSMLEAFDIVAGNRGS
jgi:hypothetical protein